jgi:hypothetical protein
VNDECVSFVSIWNEVVVTLILRITLPSED